MSEISYCATHHTYLEPNEPCWTCANPYITEAEYEVFSNALRLTCPYCHGTEKVYQHTEYNRTLLHHMHRSKQTGTLYHCEASKLRDRYPSWAERWNQELQGAKV